MKRFFLIKKVAIASLVAICASACSQPVPVTFLAQDGGTYKGAEYILTDFVFSKADQIYLARSEGWDEAIYGFKGDTSNNFLYQDQELGPEYCYLKKGYKIPESGKVTAIFTRGHKVTDQNIIQDFTKMVNTSCEKYRMTTDNLAHDAHGFYFAYNNCPVGSDFVGYIAFKDRKWLFINMKDSSVANAISNYRFDSPSVTLSATVITDEHFINTLKESDLDLMPASADESE